MQLTEKQRKLILDNPPENNSKATSTSLSARQRQLIKDNPPETTAATKPPVEKKSTVSAAQKAKDTEREFLLPSRSDSLSRLKETETNYNRAKAESGTDADDLSTFDRILGMLKSGTESWYGSNSSALSTYYQAGQGGRTERNNAYIAEQEAIAKTAEDNINMMLADGDYTESEMSSQQAILNDARMKIEAMKQVVEDKVQEKATEAARDYSNDVIAAGAAELERVKEGASPLGQMALEAGASLTQVGLDALAARALGLGSMGVGKTAVGKGIANRAKAAIPEMAARAAGMGVFANRSFGGAVNEARNDNATFGEQLTYGAAQTAKEVATEMLSNIAAPFAAAFGSGATDDMVKDLISRAVGKATRSEAGQRVLGALLTLAASGAGEGLEEFVGTWLEWPLKKLIYDGDMESASDTLAESIHSFAVGALSGGMGGVISADTYNVTAPNASKSAQDAAGEQMFDAEGSLAPVNENAAERKEMALSEVSENEARMKEAAYEAGKANVPREMVTLETEAQVEAYESGRRDYIQNASDEELAVENQREQEYTGSNETEVLSYGEEGNTSSGRGQRWENRLASAEQSSQLEEGAGIAPAERPGSTQAQRAAEIRNRAEAARIVSTSTAEQGISIGTRNDTMKVLPSKLWTENMRKASREQAAKGRQVIYFVGELEMSDKESGVVYTARGAISADGKRMWVRADHDTLTVEQIIKHEEYHAAAKKDPALNSRLKEKLRQKNGSEWVEALSDIYATLYFTDKDGNVTEDADYILEEILADAYADIDVLEGIDAAPVRATEASESVQSEVHTADANSENVASTDGRIRASRELNDKEDTENDRARAVHGGLVRDRQSAISESAGRGNPQARGDSGRETLRFAELEGYEQDRLTRLLINAIDKSEDWRWAFAEFDMKDVAALIYDKIGQNDPMIERMKRQIPDFSLALQQAQEFVKRDVTRADVAKDHNQAAVEHFGKTYKWSETGYLLLDGSKLDFSGKHEGAPGGYRTVDHRDIGDAIGGEYGGDSYSGAMIQFMREGNIRISPESNGINLSVKPTKAQERALDDFISRARGEVILDIDDANGNAVASVEYPRGTRASKVLTDIRQYFESGTMPYVSEVSQFRFSRDASNAEALAALREQNEALRERLEYWKGQTKRTKGLSLRQDDVDKLARNIAKNYSSAVDTAEIGAEIKKLGDDMLNNTGEMSWTDVKDRALSIAHKIVNEASVLVNGEVMKDYKDMKSFLRKHKIAFNDKGDIADYNDFRKRNMGRFTISKDGTPIDDMWSELQSRFGEGYFPESIIHPADQLMHLADLMDSMQEVFANPFSYYMAEATETVANDILDSLIDENVRLTPPTFADRQAAKLDAQKRKDAEKLERLREQKNARIKEIKKQGQERTKKALEKVRTDRDKKIADIKKDFKAHNKKASESRKARELRGKIMRHAKELGAELIRPSDKHHVPEALKSAAARVLEAINLESNFEYEYGRDAKYHRVKPGESALSEVTKRTAAFSALKKAYAEIAGDLVIDPDLFGGDGVSGLFDEVLSMGDVPIANMSVEQLTAVWNTLRAVEASIRSANKAFAAGRFETISEAAEALRKDNTGKTAAAEYKGFSGLQRLALLKMLTPEAYFHRLGSSGDAIFRMMRNAQDKHISIMKAVSDFTHKTLDGLNVRDLEREVHAVKLGGEDVQLSTAQIMELYVLMRRKQALAHIAEGGILPEEVSSKGLKKIIRTTPVRGVTLEEIAKTVALLSPEQVKVAEALQEYASTVLSDYGNGASMEVYNYKKFLEKMYWPIRTNKQETKSTTEKDTAITSVANRGFTKSTKPNANTSVKLGSIFDTFATHSSEMATYAAWLGATEDINRIRNFTFRDGTTHARVDTVKGIFDRVHGTGGSDYVQKLLADIANGIKGTHSETGLTAPLVGNYKAASVGANLRVVIQQPTAILRAFEMIAPKYFVSGSNPAKGYEAAKKYSPIAQWKDWGYFDIHTGRQMKDVLFDSDSVVEKAKEAAMFGASKMDSISWGMLWNAVEAEVKDTTDLTPGSTEFYKAVAERFNEIIDHTQVVDGILQRSQIMRSNDGLVKMATSFMGEPTKQYNMLLSAAYDAKHSGSNVAKKHFARTAVTLVVSATVNAMAQSLMDALRDDDREKDYWEKWLKAFVGIGGDESAVKNALSSNIAETANPLNYLPFVKDFSSLISGYDVSRMDMDGVDKVLTAGKYLMQALSGEGKMTREGAVINMLAETSRLFGIPVANLRREIESFTKTYAVETNNYVMQYRMEKFWSSLYHSGNKKEFMDILYDAYTNDTEAYMLIYRDLVKSKAFATEDTSTEESIADAMDERLVKDKGVKSVKDLDERYMTPEQKKVYNKTVSAVKQASIWNKASKAQQKKTQNLIYELATGKNSSAAKSARENIAEAKEYDLTETDYLLYKLALDVVDKPNSKGKMGTYSADEMDEALDMLTGYSYKQEKFLRSTT